MGTDMTAGDGEALATVASHGDAAHGTVEETTRSIIRDAILAGFYRPGQRLPQDSIARALGVSRMPVRASLRQLETEGLVVFETNCGATVRTLSPAEIDEIYEMRMLLEPFALRRAHPLLAPSDYAVAHHLADDLRQARTPVAWVRARAELARVLYGARRLPRTWAQLAALRRVVTPYLVQRDFGVDRRPHTLVESLERGDVDDAVRQLEACLDAGRRLTRSAQTADPTR